MEERGIRDAGPHRGTPRPAHLIFLLLFVAAALSAQSLPRVRSDALVGFNGVVRGGRYAPVIVSVEGPAARLSVKVGVEVLWGTGLRSARGSRSFTREAILAGGATKRVFFVVPMPRDARTLVVSVSSSAGVLSRQEIELHPMVTTDRLVAVVSSELAFDALAGLGQGTDAVRLAYPRLDDLPDSWAGYDGLDMVVVHDTYFQQLRAGQVSALERWVAAGGTLVFTGGAASLQLGSSGAGRLLPVEIGGIVERDGLPALAGFAGSPRGPRGRIILAGSRPVAGTVMAEEAGVPVIVRRALGAGAVWFMAFDPTLPPVASWDGALGLWRAIAGGEREPVLGSVSREPLDDPWMKALLGSPPLSFPSPLIVLPFVAAYFLLLFVACAGRISRRMKRGLRMLLLSVVPLAACLYAGLAFNQVLFRPGPQVVEASRVSLRSGDGLAMATEWIGLVTAMQGSVSVTLASRDAVVDEVAPWAAVTPGRPGPDRSLDVELGDAAVIRDATIPRYGSRLFICRDLIPLAVTLERRMRGSTLELAARNGSARVLRECFFLEGGRAYPVGDIAPGEAVVRSFGVRDGLPAQDPGTRARLMADPRKAELWSLDTAGRDAETGVLACWMEGVVPSVSFSGAEPAIGRPAFTLVLVEAQ
jgi:hypothetical protein